MHQACVDLSHCGSLAATVSTLIAAGLLPAHTAPEHDALAAAWCDLAWLPAQAYAWCFPGAAALQANDPGGFDALLDALDQAAAAWAQAHIGLFAAFGLPAETFEHTDAATIAETGEVAAEASEEVFPLRGEFIELNQLLKLVGLCESGAAGKALVAAGEVTVDGQVEHRKTAKIRDGQTVEARGVSIRVYTPS
ncbi:RNA-binding S4 domain-containing protein [Oleiagrimonas sp. C23AA]|nr:RNA-binding S4 domain-containing protein [Oleiagrimonas sp. C23AA]